MSLIDFHVCRISDLFSMASNCHGLSCHLACKALAHFYCKILQFRLISLVGLAIVHDVRYVSKSRSQKLDFLHEHFDNAYDGDETVDGT